MLCGIPTSFIIVFIQIWIINPTILQQQVSGVQLQNLCAHIAATYTIIMLEFKAQSIITLGI